MVLHSNTQPSRKGLTMWENQENQTPAENAEGEAPKATYEELETNLATATATAERYKSDKEMFLRLLTNRNDQIAKLEEYLRENWEDLDEHAEAIVEIFGLEMTSTKTFTFEVSVTVEVEAESPAYDWDNFDGSEIDLDISASVSGYRSTGLSDATVEDSEITSCEEA